MKHETDLPVEGKSLRVQKNDFTIDFLYLIWYG